MFDATHPAGTTTLVTSPATLAVVAPLSVGTHVLHWQGTADIPEAPFHFAQDIAYHITVAP